MPRFIICLLIAALIIIGVSAAYSAEPIKLGDKVYERSLVSMGDTARLQRAITKAEKGGKFVVGTIGGSITQGASASTPDKNWSSLVAKWWKDHFPKADVKLVNAGIGATGSLIAAHREYNDLLKYKPDVVVCEFSVNDGNEQLSAETLEGVVRQALNSANKPPVMLLFTMNNVGGNAQEWHSKVGSHYKLPMLSSRDALTPEVESGKMKWTDILADVVHPNDAGHAYYAGFVTRVFDTVRAGLQSGAKPGRLAKVPKPLFSDVFEFAHLYNADNLVPSSNNGWGFGNAWSFGKCWTADKAGAELEFDVAGDTISIMYFRIKRDMGIVEARIDDREPVKLDGWFDQDWGGYSAFAILGRNLGPGIHKVRIKVLEEKAPSSNGHLFEVHAILTAGK